MTRPPLHPSVDYSFDGVVAEIRLSRPERLNAVDVGLTRGLVAALTHAGEDGARAVVLSGAGRAFCAGHDLKEMQAGRQAEDGGAAYFGDLFTRCASVMNAIRTLPQPVIARVQGAAPNYGVPEADASDEWPSCPRSTWTQPAHHPPRGSASPPTARISSRCRSCVRGCT